MSIRELFFGSLTGAAIAQAVAVIVTMLAAAAWFKSAVLQRPLKPSTNSLLDRWTNKISTEPPLWNVIAALLTMIGSVAQAIAFLLSNSI